MEELVEVNVAVLGRALGLRGEVMVDLRTDEPERRLAVGSRLAAVPPGRETGPDLTVRSHRWQSGRLVLSFDELPDRTAVEAVRGHVLVTFVDPRELPEEADEFYDRQLVGLRVLDHRAVEVGTVATVLHLPAQDLLEIDTADGPVLVPFVAELVPSVDLAAGEVQLAERALADADG